METKEIVQVKEIVQIEETVQVKETAEVKETVEDPQFKSEGTACWRSQMRTHLEI